MSTDEMKPFLPMFAAGPSYAEQGSLLAEARRVVLGGDLAKSKADFNTDSAGALNSGSKLRCPPDLPSVVCWAQSKFSARGER